MQWRQYNNIFFENRSVSDYKITHRIPVTNTEIAIKGYAFILSYVLSFIVSGRLLRDEIVCLIFKIHFVSYKLIIVLFLLHLFVIKVILS